MIFLWPCVIVLGMVLAPTTAQGLVTEGPASTTDLASPSANTSASTGNETMAPPSTTSDVRGTRLPVDGNVTANGTAESITDPALPASPTTTAATAVTTTTARTKTTTRAKPKQPRAGINTGTIIVIIIIIALFIIGAACLLTRKRSRRYSIDLRSRQEDAQIPLSTVDPEVFETSSQKGMQTFSDNTDAKTTEVKDLQSAAEGEEPEKAQADKPAGETGPKSPTSALAPAPSTSVDKPGEGTLTLAPPGKPEHELDISNKTSMESLEEAANQNNSNNNAALVCTPPRAWTLSSTFYEVPLDNPV